MVSGILDKSSNASFDGNVDVKISGRKKSGNVVLEKVVEIPVGGAGVARSHPIVEAVGGNIEEGGDAVHQVANDEVTTENIIKPKPAFTGQQLLDSDFAGQQVVEPEFISQRVVEPEYLG